MSRQEGLKQLISELPRTTEQERLIYQLRCTQQKLEGWCEDFRSKLQTEKETNARVGANLDEAVRLLMEYRAAYPAFGAKPMGAPGSFMREAQRKQIELEGQAEEFLKRVKAAE